MGGQKITRYVDLGRFLAMFGERDESPKGRLFFASADRLSDPQEGILGSADRKLALNEAKNLYGGVDRRAFACWLSREWQNSLLMVGISCWYLGDTESHAMWQIFGTGGVAIESTVEKVKNCLAPAAKIQTRLVEYVDRATRPATGLDPVRVLSFKRPPYQHEKELRFFVSFSDEERELIKNLRGLGQDGEVFVHDRTQGQLGPNGMSVPSRCDGGHRSGCPGTHDSDPLTIGSAFTEAESSVRSRTSIPLSRRASRNKDRKSTRLNSSHTVISYAVFC